MALVIARGMPQPPESVSRAFDLVKDLVAEGAEAKAEMAVADRPWVPAHCADQVLRRAVWGWCDEVAGWLNEQYVWLPDQYVPACWPLHPHIAHELPVLAFTLWAAQHADTIEPLTTWQEQTFPRFCERMTARLGAGHCRDGRHDTCPGKPRQAAYYDRDAVTRRHAVIDADTGGVAV